MAPRTAALTGAPRPPWAPPTTPPVAGPIHHLPRPRRRRPWTLAAAIAVAAGALTLAATGALAPSSTSPNVADQRLPTPAATANPSGQGTSTADAAVDRAVVDITTTVAGGEAAGTGMVLTSGGLVLTNNHVIQGATSIAVQIAGEGPSYKAHVVGYDVTDDIAVIQLEDVSRLATIPVGKSASLGVGDDVVAIGNALGESGPHAITSGAVQALDQTVTANGDLMGTSETLHGLIEHDAPLQPGDSGGPLVNGDGQVVGMNTIALTSGRRFNDSGSVASYAIPMDDAMAIAHQIIAGEASATVHIGERGVIGVEIDDQSGNGDGVVIAQVNDGPAADAGVQAGDTITNIDGTAIRSLADVQSSLGQHKPGDHVKLAWTTSDGTSRSATVTLIAGPPA
jgi:S1-C subfamily serine protease